MIVLNVNGCNILDRKAYGGIFRLPNGIPIVAFNMAVLEDESIGVIETRVICDELRIADVLGFRSLCTLSDPEFAVKVLNGDYKQPWACLQDIRDAKNIITRMDSCFISIKKREGNKAGYLLLLLMVLFVVRMLVPSLLCPCGRSYCISYVCVIILLSCLGVPWTEDEHRMFLLGLQKLGKGDWRGIARNYVISRTPTQVASHAQKYFIRQTNMSRRKRRSSLFDIVADESADTQFVSHELFPMSHHHQSETQSNNNQHLPAPPSIDEECESMDSTNSNDEEAVISNPESLQLNYPVMIPTYFSPFVPYPLPYWPGGPETIPKETHKVVKPTAVHSNSPINVDELVGMSKLSLGERSKSSPSLSLSLQQGSNRQSAFHANPTTETSSMNSNSSSPIHAL
ncbi:hypothetical protein GIB67_015598 [Kingdonia uniflora]|uniref:Uncharacterized protein n=1 Tax=Kingdonia uniflora TaxID=39325 RepID=A0A7J7LUG7_9MAGN|nr:hypothetical protein GIB67_015598 [Kingdonia uniflora]